MRIAITGGIGSGKSFVCRQLEQIYGIEVFNCDIVAKNIIATHPDVRQALAELIASDSEATGAEPTALGSEPTAQAYEPSGAAVLTKEALGAYIRRGPDYAARVNAIVHPRVAQTFELYCKHPTRAMAPAVRKKNFHWMECAILFESGFDRLVDHVIVVTCPTDERIRRIVARDKCSADTARRWIELQLSDEERIARAAAHNIAAGSKAPFVIRNDRSIQLDPLLDFLIKSIS